MTYNPPSKHMGRLAVAVSGLAILGFMSAAGATAQDNSLAAAPMQSAQYDQTPDFVVKSAATPSIRSGAQAFTKGDHDLAVTYNLRALKSGLSKSRKAIAYNNLAAAYGARGEYAEAIEASNSALNLRPDLWEALHNRGAAKLAAGNLQAGNTDMAAAMAAKG